MNTFMGHQPHDFGHHVQPHAVIEPSPGEHHLRVVAYLRRLVCQIIWIDPNAVTTDQTWPKWQKVPLRTSGLQHFLGVYAEPFEYKGKFVDQRDVDVALRIFDDLRGLRHANATHLVRAGGHDRAVELVDEDRRGPRRAGRDLADRAQTMFLVTGIDALRAVADKEISIEPQARY